VDSYAKRLTFKDQSVTVRFSDALRKAGLPDKPPLPLPDKPSIAVLPFVNMSEDPKQEYFCDGLAEEVINALARVPQVYVIARNSSFTYKGKAVDVKQVGREMGVKYVLEGSVRREESRVRITAQLVDATAGNHVFSERYDRELKDIFALQDDITMRILTAIQVNLTEGQQARVHGKGTKVLEAYLGTLEVSELAIRLNKEDNALARKKCEEVLALDPQYARAWGLLSLIYLMNFQWGIEPETSLRKAQEAAQKAVSLDGTLGSAHMQLGFLYAFTRRYEEGIAESERAVQLDPGSANVHANLGRVLEIAGQPKEALGHIEKAIRLNPIPPAWYWQHLGFAHMQLEQYEDAVVAFKKTLAIAPKHRHVLVGLVSTYALMGRMDDARAVAQEILGADPRFNPGKGRLFHKDEAFNKRFAEGIKKAGLLKDASAN
jgi:adenylate cyclase